jgi:hypothetical protein
MRLHDLKVKHGRIIAMFSCSLLIIVSIITSLQQIPAMSQSRRTYDDEYVDALRYIADLIPRNETLAATEIYPQITYFTDHKVKVPWVRSERALVEFMWDNNSTRLLVPEYTAAQTPDSTPLLVQLVERPFEKISDFYAKYISVPRPDSTPSLNTTSISQQPDNDDRPLNIRQIVRGDMFKKLFDKVLDYPTENTLLHIYQLRSNITRDNLMIVTDDVSPILSVYFPVNGTVMTSESFGVLRVNMTGSAEDVDSEINKVEVSIAGSPFRLATPRAPDDWSTWSYSGIVPAGTRVILVKATDNADNEVSVPVHITIM